MVNSSVHKKLFGEKRTGGGSRYSGFPAFNQNMIGGKRNGGSDSFLKLLNDKKEFLIAVFANLITQLGITYYVMMNYKSGAGQQGFMYWGLFIVEILIILALALIPMPSWMKFILFSIFCLIFFICSTCYNFIYTLGIFNMLSFSFSYFL